MDESAENGIMVTAIDKLTQDGCSTDDKDKVCRARGRGVLRL